jgi:hypothetical protein
MNMDDYTLQLELETLAGNAYNLDLDNNITTNEPISTTIIRWHTLFNISHSDAIDRIMEHRNNLTRTRIPNAHWDEVEAEKTALGYDREAYEYELDLQKKKALLPALLPAATENSSVSYLVELSGPLDTAEKVRVAAGLEAVPEVVGGRSVEEDRAVLLCCIDADAKSALLQWAANEGGGFEPTILVNPTSLR